MARTNQHWSEHVVHISQGVDRSPGSNPASDAILYRRVVDFPGNVTADGKHHDTFTITFSDIQAAWSKDGHTDALPATVKLVAWGSDGMPDNANMTKVNWSGDDIDVLNVDEKSGLVTAQKEGCSDVRAVADYTDPTVFDPVMASVQVCVRELDKDEIAVNHLRVDMEEGETVTLQAVASREVQGCHPARWNCDNGGDNRRCEVCEAGCECACSVG